MSSLTRGSHVDLEEEYPSGAELVLHPMRPLQPTNGSREYQHLAATMDKYSSKIRRLGFFKAVKAQFGKDIFTEPWPEQEEPSTQHTTQSESTVLTATFIQHLCVNEWKPAQLILVSLSGGVGPLPPTTRYIAMIFDPAVHRCNNPDTGVNPVKQMQAQFSRDVHARTSLRPASYLPEFHGSFWAEWSARRVGVVLLEDLGIGRVTWLMSHIQPHGGTIGKDRRKRIIANIIKMDLETRSRGIDCGMWIPGNFLLRLTDDKIFPLNLAYSVFITPRMPTIHELLKNWNSPTRHYELINTHWIPLPPKLPDPNVLKPDQKFLMDCLKLMFETSEEFEEWEKAEEAVSARRKAKRPATKDIGTDENPSSENRYNLRSKK